MPDQSEAPIVRKLLAPAYWMSGSSDGHEGENEAPREAAEIIRLCEEALEGVEEFLLESGFVGYTLDEVRAALAQIKGQNP